MNISRRDVLAQTFAAGISLEIAGALQHAQGAFQRQAGFEVLSAADARDVESLACQILPSDDGPGAREAGVIYFIDRALGTFDKKQKGLYRRGLETAHRKRRTLFPKSENIASLSSAQQIELLRSFEDTPFFEVLRTHTVLGFLGSPVYGGNRGGVGWTYIGFEDGKMFEPPFGYYDAEAGKETR